MYECLSNLKFDLRRLTLLRHFLESISRYIEGKRYHFVGCMSAWAIWNSIYIVLCYFAIFWKRSPRTLREEDTPLQDVWAIWISIYVVLRYIAIFWNRYPGTLRQWAIWNSIYVVLRYFAIFWNRLPRTLREEDTTL